MSRVKQQLPYFSVTCFHNGTRLRELKPDINGQHFTGKDMCFLSESGKTGKKVWIYAFFAADYGVLLPLK
jgi:hypothetical protein